MNRFRFHMSSNLQLKNAQNNKLDHEKQLKTEKLKQKQNQSLKQVKYNDYIDEQLLFCKLIGLLTDDLNVIRKKLNLPENKIVTIELAKKTNNMKTQPTITFNNDYELL